MSINGVRHNLWRAVSQGGNVLDIPVQSRRDKAAAGKCFRRLLKGRAHVPRALIADTPTSTGRPGGGPAERRAPPTQATQRPRGAPAPAHARARARMGRLKSPGHARRFLAAHGPIASHFRPRRHRPTAAPYRQTRDERFAIWREVTGTPALV